MPFEFLKSEIVYPGRAFTIRRDTLRLPDGHETRLDIVEHVGSVIILPVDDQGNLLFVRQYRHARPGWISWSCQPGPWMMARHPKHVHAASCGKRRARQPGYWIIWAGSIWPQVTPPNTCTSTWQLSCVPTPWKLMQMSSLPSSPSR